MHSPKIQCAYTVSLHTIKLNHEKTALHVHQHTKVFHLSENILVTPDCFPPLNELLFSYENYFLKQQSVFSSSQSQKRLWSFNNMTWCSPLCWATGRDTCYCQCVRSFATLSLHCRHFWCKQLSTVITFAWNNNRSKPTRHVSIWDNGVVILEWLRGK